MQRGSFGRSAQRLADIAAEQYAREPPDLFRTVYEAIVREVFGSQREEAKWSSDEKEQDGFCRSVVELAIKLLQPPSGTSKHGLAVEIQGLLDERRWEKWREQLGLQQMVLVRLSDIEHLLGERGQVAPASTKDRTGQRAPAR